MEIIDLLSLEGRGPAWGTASEDLNATLLVWRAGEGQPEHVNEERDVAFVVLAGSGRLTVAGMEHDLAVGSLAILPRGAARSVVAGPEGLRCLTVHRRRGGLGLADFRTDTQEGRGGSHAPSPRAGVASASPALPPRTAHHPGVASASPAFLPRSQPATASSTASGMSKFA